VVGNKNLVKFSTPVNVLSISKTSQSITLINHLLLLTMLLLFAGCERFSDYDGYAKTFEWKMDYYDKTPR